MFDDGAAVDLSQYSITGHLKLKLSDSGAIDQFTTNALSDAGHNNIIEITLSADQTTCLPITELVYDIEITHKTTYKVEKVLLGYFAVKPEVTRDASDCQASWSLLTTRGESSSSSTLSSASSTSSSASYDCKCFGAFIRRALNTFDNTYIFTVEVDVDNAAMKGITSWKADLAMIDSKGRETLHESELIENVIDPNAATFGYEIIYPVGGGRYRFINKNDIAFGKLTSVFSVPVPVHTFHQAKLMLTTFSPTCPPNGSEVLEILFDPTLIETSGTTCS